MHYERAQNQFIHFLSLGCKFFILNFVNLLIFFIGSSIDTDEERGQGKEIMGGRGSKCEVYRARYDFSYYIPTTHILALLYTI